MARGQLIELVHPLPVLLTVLAGAGFALLAAGGAPPISRLALFVGSLTLTQCAISVHNDYCDREIDCTAKPWRPIPSGLISPGAALALAVVLATIGLGLSVPLGWAALLLAVVGTGAGLAYSARLKRSALSWLPFLIGFPTLVLWAFAAVERWEPLLLGAYVVGAPLVLALHLADTLPDIESDSASGVRGLGHRLGALRARLATWVALGAAAALVGVLRPAGAHLGPPYLLAIGLVGLVVLVGWRSVGRAHWIAVVAAALALALEWVAAISIAGSSA